MAVIINQFRFIGQVVRGEQGNLLTGDLVHLLLDSDHLPSSSSAYATLRPGEGRVKVRRVTDDFECFAPRAVLVRHDPTPDANRKPIELVQAYKVRHDIADGQFWFPE